MHAHPALPWNDSMMSGIPEIDEQHMILVHTLNEAGEKLGKEVSLDMLETITQNLLSYALYHFETEEALMQEYGYAAKARVDAQQHLAEHRHFSLEVLDMRDKLKAGILIPPAELLEFLKGWLANHIMHTDRRLTAFILASRAAA